MSTPPATKKNLWRRLIGAIVCLTPLGLFLVSAVLTDRLYSLAALGPLLPALAISTFNFYLSFGRPYFYLRRHGSFEDYRNVSGIPVFGDLFAVFGGIVGFGALSTAVLGLATVLLDTGGLFWFLIATWHDTGMWDEN